MYTFTSYKYSSLCIDMVCVALRWKPAITPETGLQYTCTCGLSLEMHACRRVNASVITPAYTLRKLQCRKLSR